MEILEKYKIGDFLSDEDVMEYSDLTIHQRMKVDDMLEEKGLCLNPVDYEQHPNKHNKLIPTIRLERSKNER